MSNAADGLTVPTADHVAPPSSEYCQVPPMVSSTPMIAMPFGSPASASVTEAARNVPGCWPGGFVVSSRIELRVGDTINTTGAELACRTLNVARSSPPGAPSPDAQARHTENRLVPWM